VILNNNGFPQCSNTINTITTNWASPQSINQWDWTQQFFNDMYIDQDGTTGAAMPVQSPFYSTGLIDNPNVSHFQIANSNTPYDGVDFHPEDGWELLAKDFGLQVNPVSYPLFALYNKYTGLIRVFVYIPIAPFGDMQNGALLKLSFGTDRESALLSHLQPILKLFGSFNKGNVMNAPNFYVNQDDFWLYAEFPTAYDPCACNYQSMLRFQVKFIEEADISLNGELNGLISQVITGGPGGNVSTSDGFLAISDFELENFEQAYKSGQKSYKEWSKYATQAQNFANNNQQWLSDQFSIDIGKLSNFTKAIPYVGAIVGVIDYMITGGKKKEETKLPTPMVFESKQYFSINGGMTTQSPIVDKLVWNPGTNLSATTSKPVYENILGVFNFISVPPLQYVTYSGISDPDKKIDQYKPTGDFQYVLNPAAGLKVKGIDVAVQIRYYSASSVNPNPPTLINEIGLSGFVKPVEFGPPSNYGGVPIHERMKNVGFTFDQIPNTFPNDGKQIMLRTAYAPIECSNDISFSLYRQNPGYALNPSFYYKFIVELERLDDPTGQNVMLVLTVKANDVPDWQNTSNLTFSIDQGSYGLLNYYYPVETFVNGLSGSYYSVNPAYLLEQDITFENQSLNESKSAIGKITFKNNVTIQANKVYEAGKSIEINTTNLISNDNILLIPNLSFASCFTNIETQKFPDASLVTFCAPGGAYDGHSQRVGKSDHQQFISPQINAINIFPSITSSEIQFYFKDEPDSPKVIKIYTSLGELIISKEVKILNNFKIDIKDYLPGVYHVETFSNGIRTIKKVIKI